MLGGYYRRLKPGGARIVRRRVGVGDWIGVERVGEVRESGEGDEGRSDEREGEERERVESPEEEVGRRRRDGG